MDTQIDDIALRSLLLPLGEKILKELEKKIMARRKESWFEIYLTTFIIMNNFERHFADIIEWTSDRGIKVIMPAHAFNSNRFGPSPERFADTFSYTGFTQCRGLVGKDVLARLPDPTRLLPLCMPGSSAALAALTQLGIRHGWANIGSSSPRPRDQTGAEGPWTSHWDLEEWVDLPNANVLVLPRHL